MRRTAHQIADFIYEKLTGERGVFSTRIAYVVKQGTRFELRIADADGQGAQIDPHFARAHHVAGLVARRDANGLRFVPAEEAGGVRAESRSPASQPTPVANYQGSNSAPAWSPDGKQLAVVLSKDGGSQIYFINADGTNLRRLTISGGIDTEPFFSPDGQSHLLHLGPRRQPADLPHAGRPGASRPA